MLVVDTRWNGPNGIGRYSREVLPRLSLDWEPIHPSGSPSAPLDFALKNLRVAGNQPSALYSPGYNGFLKSVPQTITVHDLIHLQGKGASRYRAYYDLFLAPLIRKNRHVITVSETSKNHIARWLGTSEVEIVNAGNGSSAEFGPQGQIFEAERPYVLFVGNLKPHKNLPTLLRAIGASPDVDLIAVVQDKDGFTALAKSFGVETRAHVMNSLDDGELAALYRGARATVQPSLIEGFGLPALESALCATPVIYFDGCESVREICAGGGIPVFNPTDELEWARAISGVLEGQRFPAGRVTREQYSWDATALTVSRTLDRYSP